MRMNLTSRYKFNFNNSEIKEAENMAAEINFLVGCEAGQGVQTVGFILVKTMSRAGLHVFADQDY